MLRCNSIIKRLVSKVLIITAAIIIFVAVEMLFIGINSSAAGGDYAVGIKANEDNSYRLIGYHKASDIGTELLNNCTDTRQLWNEAIRFAKAGSSSNEIEIHLWCDLTVDVGTEDFLYNEIPGWRVVVRTEDPDSTGKYTLTINGQGNLHPLFRADNVLIHSLDIVDNRTSGKDVGIAEATTSLEVLDSDIYCMNAEEILHIDNRDDSNLKVIDSLIDGATSCNTGIYLGASVGEVRGSIISNCTGCGIRNNSNATLDNTKIHDDFCGIDNTGVLRIFGAATDIYDNADAGIHNSGVIYHTDGSVRDNGCFKADSSDYCAVGVYQDGEYHIGGNARISYGFDRDNAMYLPSGKYVNVIESGGFDGEVMLTLPTTDRVVGKELVKNGFDDENNFRMAFYSPVKNSNGSDFDGVDYYGSKALIRAGMHNNKNPDTSLFLSAAYYFSYDANNRENTVSYPAFYKKDIFLWNESFLARFGTNEYTLTDGTWQYIQTGWTYTSHGVLSKSDMKDKVISGFDSHTTCYGEYDIVKRVRGRVNYKANGACDDRGLEYSDVMDDYETSLDDNYAVKSGSIFGKEQYVNNTYVKGKGEIGTDHISGESDVYYYTKEKDIVNDMGSKDMLASFQGWSLVSYLTSREAEGIMFSKGVHKFINIFYGAEAVGLLGFDVSTIDNPIDTMVERIITLRNRSIEAWNNKTKGILYQPIEESGVIDVYAIWDMYPEIHAPRISFTEDELKEGLTEKDLLKKAVAIDKEDGVITDKLKVEDFENVIKQLEEVQASNYTGCVTVAYTVSDSVGNMTKAFALVYINSNTSVDVYYPNGELGGYVRTINKHAYDTHNLSMGGCVPDSVWYEESDYVELMERGFENLKNNTPIMSYTYSKEDREKMSEHMHSEDIKTMYDANMLRWYVDNYMDEAHISKPMEFEDESQRFGAFNWISTGASKMKRYLIELERINEINRNNNLRRLWI